MVEQTVSVWQILLCNSRKALIRQTMQPALYEMMNDNANPWYDVVFYPQYETTKTDSAEPSSKQDSVKSNCSF